MEFRKKNSIFLQIADHICENILANKIQPGDRLESVREMAANVQVNPNTVMRTFSHLQDRGIIFNKRGIGNFVSDDALEKIKEMKKQEFIQNQLPEIFKMMELLDISFDELKKIHQQLKK